MVPQCLTCEGQGINLQPLKANIGLVNEMNDDVLIKRLHTHLEKLSVDFPHRGSCTLNEGMAQSYCAEVLRSLGLKPEAQEFRSVASAYRPFILASALLLLTYPLFQWMPLAAGLLAAAVTISALMELMLMPNLLTLILPKSNSRNLIVRIPAGRESRRILVVMSHIDSHRTPWIFRTPTTFRVYQLLSTMAMLAFVELPVLYGLDLLGVFHLSGIYAAPALALIAVIFFMTLQAEHSPYTAGANDNASGVALLLELARRFRAKPLEYQDVWLVISGCEEVGAHGARAFVKRYGKELRDAVVLVIDNIAGKDTVPCYYEKETMLLPMKYPSDMLALAREVAEANPAFGARPFSQRGAYTDGTPVLQAGLSCISIVNHTASGWIPYWHHPDDTLSHIDWEAYHRSIGFILKLIERLEKQAAS